jgi:tetratricopeptide (TPR) repeat protein
MNLMLEKNFKSQDFKTVRKVYNGHLFDKNDYMAFDNSLKVAQAFSYYENGNYDTALDILMATGDEFESVLKFNLLGNIYFRHNDIPQSSKQFQKSLKKRSNNNIALNNFTLVLIKKNDPKVFKQWAIRYPEIEKLRIRELTLKEVKLQQTVLWERLFNSSKETFSFGSFIKGILSELFKLPIIYYIIFFIIYILVMKKLSPNLGESTYCSKCSKIIKEASVHRSYKLCDECYQLFSIKDVIFLEAKILKEKELKKKFAKYYFLYLIFSILIPGLNFNQRENNRLFLVLSTIFYFLLGFAVVGAINFNYGFSAAPLFLNLIGMCAVAFYFVVNLFSVLGDEDGI